MTRALFPDQINPLSPLLVSADHSLNDSKGFFDLNAGVMGSSKLTDKVNSYLGFSVFHLTQPDESFAQGGSESLPLRYTVHGGAEYLFVKRVALLPSLIYMRQRNRDELNLGTAFVFKM